MLFEEIFLGHDNAIDLILLADGELADLTNIQRMTLEFKNIVVDSDTSPTAFDWSEGDGKVFLMMGEEAIPLGSYNAVLTAYDNVNDDGVVWDTFRCRVK